MGPISEKLQGVHTAIRDAARTVSRDAHAVALLAVSKTFGPDAVLAAADAGQRAFGENYVQEALDKMQAVRDLRPDLALEWHFIGPIQSNKTKPIAEHFDWVHSVDREKIARRLSEQRPTGMPPLNVCLQVNISREESKAGVMPEKTLEIAQAIAAMPGLRLRGLMAIPAPTDDPAAQQAAFRAVRELFDTLRATGLDIDTLSMGMSADLGPAIAEGATIVRVGSAIFGQRTQA